MHLEMHNELLEDHTLDASARLFRVAILTLNPCIVLTLYAVLDDHDCMRLY